MAAAAILGVVASLVGPAVQLGKCFQKQLNYFCCFQSNVKALDDAAKNLADAEADLQVRVDGAKRNGEQILNQVETWLAKAGETRLNNTLGIRTPRIFNLKSRYCLSRKAIKTAQSMNLLRDTCSFDLVSNPALPTSMHYEGRPLIPPAPGGGIESRKKTEDDIIIAVRERNAYVIGVCGMGGVGKTTMAKQIMNRAKEDERLFDEVLLVPVGQHVDMLQIQHGILDWLGLKLNEETVAPRAIRLRDRLLGGNRKLIVIDDVWERINLEELGIPCQSDSCTILLTSRDSRVLRQMNALRVFTVKILSEEEAWFMFQENVGACLDDDPNLLPTARDVVKECKGLPLALVAVSRALKDQASKGIWSDALKQLKSSNPMDIPGFIEDVYSPIRLSFDFLESPHAKSLLFLCSSVPGDLQIGLEGLALCGFGLCILGDDIDNLEDARNRITSLVVMLKSRSLILDGEDEHYVKMHDVVRDVANFIAKKENHAILDSTSLDRSKQIPHINDCSMLSVFQNQSRFDFPTGLIFPNLSFLWMYYKPGYIKCAVSDNFFKGMQQLKVLSVTSFSLGLTQQNMRLLDNLRTLHLSECHLETLSAVGELSSLEILCFESCYSITELPVEIGRLQSLRILDVTDCFCLRTIVPGVISRLGQLEELKMVNSFTGWESKEIENERRNASLAELQSLSKLTCLEIEIEHWSLDAQVLQLSSKIVKYNIQVGESSSGWEPRSYEKKLSVSLQMSTSLRNWIDVFARTAEYLCLDVVDSNGFDFSGHQNMRCLVCRNCETVVKLVSSASTDCGSSVFPDLEEIHLVSLPKFEEICDGPIPNGSNSFAKLKEISLSNLDGLLHVWRSKNQNVLLANLSTVRISCCGKLRRVFSSSVVIRSLSQLSSLEIEDCELMEEVFWIEKDDGNSSSSCITFPKLKTLSLKRLENLTYFCKGIDIIEFPQLFQLDIKYCPKLTSLGKASDHQNHITFGSLLTLCIGGYKNSSYLWCHDNPHLFFCQLEKLELFEISNISNLFSYSIAANLVNLKILKIWCCDEMAYVIADDNIATTSGKNPPKIFHKLERLELIGLHSLRAFCKGIHDINIEFCLPAGLIIKNCPKLTSFINIQSDQNDHFNSSSTHHPTLHLICYTKNTFRSLHPFFSNLEVLIIKESVNMKNLFSYSVAANLVNLKILTIESCDEMAYVVAEDDATEISQTKTHIIIIFHKLEKLILCNLPKLQNFCEGRWDIQLPSLKQLNIKNVGGFYSACECVPLFCNTQSSFGSSYPLFCNLEELYIEDCVNMNNLFSYSVAVNLVNLRMLTIKSCDEMAYVIAGDHAETSKTKLQQIIFHKLEELRLHDLPKLQNFCEERWHIKLPSLKELDIENVGFYSTRECVPLVCNTQSTFNKLTSLCIEGYLGDRDHIKHLFSYSVAGNLVNLETLDIGDYKEMVYVIADDVDDIAKTTGNNPQTIFHKLEYLTLDDLPKLQNFCEGRWDLQLPSLKLLYMTNVGFYSARDCVPLFCNAQSTFDKLTYLSIQGNLGDRDHMKHLFSYSVAGNLVNLKELRISNFSEMVYVIADIGDDITKTSGNNPQTIEGFNEMLYAIAYHDDAKTSETKTQQIIFQKLEELKLYDLPKLQNFCEGRCDLQLPSLKELDIKNVGGFYSTRECVHLFCNAQITFDKLRDLHIQGNLGDRDYIKHLFSYSVALNLVNLQKLTIKSCYEMAYMVTEDDAAETSETKPQQIIFQKLEWLKLHDLPKLQNFCEGRCDHQLPSLERLDIKNVGFYSARECVPLFCNTQITFDKLTELDIQGNLGDGDDIKHLFSYSVARNLVNLKTLEVSHFSEMIYVIADDVDDVAKTSHEKKPQAIFHNLQWVEVSDLPRLQSLCDWGWDVQFPSLKRLDIIDCPGMEGVTPELIRKQNMEAVRSRRQRVEVD